MEEVTGAAHLLEHFEGTLVLGALRPLLLRFCRVAGAPPEVYFIGAERFGNIGVMLELLHFRKERPRLLLVFVEVVIDVEDFNEGREQSHELLDRLLLSARIAQYEALRILLAEYLPDVLDDFFVQAIMIGRIVHAPQPQVSEAFQEGDNTCVKTELLHCAPILQTQ